MKRGKKIACVAATGLIAAGVVIGGVSLQKMHFDVRQIAAVSAPETTVVAVDEAFRDLEIASETGDVTLEKSADGTCAVTSCLPQRVVCTVSVENGTLTVREKDMRLWYDHFALFATGESSIRIALPETAYDALRIASDVGDVHLPAGFTFRSAQVAADTGDVDVRSSVRDVLSVVTETGNVAVRSLHPQTLTVLTDTGDVLLSDLACGQMTAQSDTGDLSLQNVIASKAIDMITETGDMTLENCDAAELTLRSDTGDISGTLLSEKIFLTESDTGTIRVPQSITGGQCVIQTDAGDVTLRLASEQAE